MTNQERPVQEQEELLDDLLAAKDQMAVTEQEQSVQHSQTEEEQAETAAQPSAAPATEAERTEPVSAVEEETPTEAPADVSQPAEPVSAVEEETPTEAPADAPQPAEPVSAVEEETPTEAPAESAAVEAGEPAVADTSAVEPGASYTPVDEETAGRPRRVKDLEPGMELEGRVTSIALYGIFVDIGVGRDGLVHISEMSDTRIDSPSDLVQIGDTVKVRVKSVEPDGRRISLTMRSRERSEGRGRRSKKPELNREALASLRVGDTVQGTVTGIAPFGAFVDIGVGKDGLVHISELAEGRVERAEDAVQVGQTYTFKLLEVDAEGTRISLSLRRAQRAQRMQQLEKGQIIEGTVSGLAPFGAFVDIGVGRDGLVHISELAEGRVNKVEDMVKVGDRIKVRVLEFDTQSKRISLSMRLEEPAPAPAAPPAPREERGRREEPVAQPAPEEAYTGAGEEEEEPAANATLEDLLSKYGNGSKRDRRRRREEDEEDEEDRYTRRQRDAIRRTIQQLGEDE